MTISAEILALGQRLCSQLEAPDIVGLHLPELSADDEFRDEFGFVFLPDGSAAPFYVSLPGTLQQLHRRFPEPAEARLSLRQCLQGLDGSSLPERALALGAWNALSQHLIRRAGFVCPPRGSARGFEPRAGERIGMVGYFCPVIDRLVERGVEVLVIEQQPERVPRRAQVELSQELEALAECRLIYCTASTLINDSLQQVLDSCVNAEAVDLIGPTGSGLPDVLFEHGVHAVGGVSFDDANGLREVLARRESWGTVGKKYELTADNYPGVEALLAAALN
ncbi:MAG: DUF364 domain-containing protein [Gammaproteobacteria bacterium]|nr:DUF364 domain-containing protein [Gammaproteobacteria bacterium]